MASGTIWLNSTKSTLQGKIEWSSSSNGSSANSSNVSATLYIARTDSYSTKGTWGYGFTVGGASSSSSVYTSVSGSWVAVSSISTTVSHNNDGTGSCWISGYVNGPSGTSMSGYGVSGSQTVTLDYIPRYANITGLWISGNNIDSLSVGWSVDSNIDWISYCLDNGAWHDTGGNPFTVANLLPNTTHNIKIKVRRADSGLWTESWNISGTTKDQPYFSSVADFDYSGSQSVVLTNRYSDWNTTLTIKDSNKNTLKTIDLTAKSSTILFTNDEIDTFYKLLSNTSNSTTLTYSIATTKSGHSTYTDTKTVTATLATAKLIRPFRIKYKGSLAKAKVFIKRDGKVTTGVVWVKQNGSIKRGVV